jgi:hypothetical protein
MPCCRVAALAARQSSFPHLEFVMLTLEPVRARVAPSAIAKVTRMFSGSLGDILAELFQNARRAGATKINVTAMSEPSPKIMISDDGAGIASPQTLLTLGQSDWQAEATLREDPAGMGFFSLAGKAITLTSSTGGKGFRLCIPADGWTGERLLAVEPANHPRGTTIVFEASEPWLRNLPREVEQAARHFPIAVSLDGIAQKRTPFLEGAVHRKAIDGIEIGIFPRQFYTREPNINFHGLTLHHRLPTIIDTDHAHWSARIDIIDAPDLHLVLPARKELVENSRSLALDVQVKTALFEAIKAHCDQGGHHDLKKSQWDEAAALGLVLPEARALLRCWQPETADEYNGRSEDPPCVPAANAMLVPGFEPCDALMLERACELGGGAPLGQLLRAKPGYEGYGWYDAIDRITDLAVTAMQEGAPLEKDTADTLSASAERIDAAALDLTFRNRGPLTLPLDLYLASDPDEYDYPYDMTVLVTRACSLTPHELAGIITDCGFSPSDDIDAGSYQDQCDYYERKALHRAFELLSVGDDGDTAKIRNDFLEFVSWLVPKGRTLTLTYDGSDCQVALGQAHAPAEAQS